MRQQPDLLFAWDNFFMARSYSFKRFTQVLQLHFWDFYLLIHGISIIEQKKTKPVVTTIGFSFGLLAKFSAIVYAFSWLRSPIACVIQKH
jgi:hypothetical protein